MRPPGADRSGALGRTGALGRSGAQARDPARSAPLSRTRAVPRPAEGEELSLLRCQAGPYPLLLDVRALLNVDRPALRPVASGLRRIDLRQLLGAPAGPGQSLIFQLDPGREAVEILVDPGVVLLRVPLARLHPWPDPLDGLPALRGLSGVVELEDGGLAYLVDPYRL